MARKFFALAVAAAFALPILVGSPAADAHRRHSDIDYYLVLNPDGSCSIHMSRRDRTIGKYGSRSAAERARKFKSVCAASAPY